MLCLPRCVNLFTVIAVSIPGWHNLFMSLSFSQSAWKSAQTFINRLVG
jgi:hypothetical protein